MSSPRICLFLELHHIVSVNRCTPFSAIDDTATVRVTNLSEETKEQDLRDLFGHFGPIHRVYLAKDKTMQRSKVTTPLERELMLFSNDIFTQGFAFINYYKRADAQMAIQELDGHGYDHLILKVEWAKLVLKILWLMYTLLSLQTIWQRLVNCPIYYKLINNWLY